VGLHLSPWNIVSCHFEFSPNISENLFYYFPSNNFFHCHVISCLEFYAIVSTPLRICSIFPNTTLNAARIYLRQPLNSTLFQTPKRLPNAPNSSPNFAILVPSNAPLKTSQFYWLPTLTLNPLGSRTKFFSQNSNPPLVLAPLRKLRPFFLVCFLFFR